MGGCRRVAGRLLACHPPEAVVPAHAMLHLLLRWSPCDPDCPRCPAPRLPQPAPACLLLLPRFHSQAELDVIYPLMAKRLKDGKSIEKVGGSHLRPAPCTAGAAAPCTLHVPL